MSEKQALTEQQEKFLDCLFDDECQGRPLDAKRKAGYSDNYSTTRIMMSVQDHLLERTRSYLALHGPAAAIAMTSSMGMDGVVPPDAKDKLAAAREILDRGIGLVKTDRMEVAGVTAGIVFLPPKDKEVYPDDD